MRAATSFQAWAMLVIAISERGNLKRWIAISERDGKSIAEGAIIDKMDTILRRETLSRISEAPSS